MYNRWRALALLASLPWAQPGMAQTTVPLRPGQDQTLEVAEPATVEPDAWTGDLSPADAAEVADQPGAAQTPVADGSCRRTEPWPPEGCPEDYGPAHCMSDPPGWWSSVGFIAMTRSLYETNPLFDPIGDSPAWYDGTFGGYQWGTGLDLRVGYRDPSDRFIDGWEARYFGIDGAGNTGWANTGSDWTFPGDAQVWPQSIFRAGIDSRVQSVEWNVQHDAERATFTWLAGFRWLQFDDYLWGSATSSPDEAVAFQVSTANTLYGGQGGFSIAIVKDNTPLEVDVRLKGGLYANSSSGDWGMTAVSPSNWLSRRGADSATELAFVGDFEFSFVYRITERWSAALSYEALWLQGVAVAGDQSELGRLLSNATGLSSSEAAWFSGLNVGMRFRW